MDQQDVMISVLLKSGEQFNFNVKTADMAAFDKSTARFWIGEAFDRAGLESPNPVGKVLLVDQILLYASEQKSSAWATPSDELRKFLAAVAAALGRPAITIDLLNYKL